MSKQVLFSFLLVLTFCLGLLVDNFLSHGIVYAGDRDADTATNIIGIAANNRYVFLLQDDGQIVQLRANGKDHRSISSVRDYNKRQAALRTKERPRRNKHRTTIHQDKIGPLDW